MADITTLGLAVDSTGVKRATDDLRAMAAQGAPTAAAASKVGAAVKDAGDAAGSGARRFSELGGASRDLEGAMTRASVSGHLIGDAIGQGIVKIVGATAAFISLSKGIADYQDIAEKTGGSAAGFASLRTSADVTGVSIKSMADASVKLSVSLAKMDEDGGQAARGLEAIGISVEEFKKQSPDEQIRTVAKSLSGFEDGANKAAVAVSLYGRAGAEMLPFLKELGGETERNKFLTDEQIQSADNFWDAQARASSQTRQYAEVLSLQMVPVLAGVTSAFRDQVKELITVDGATGKLGSSTAIQTFAANAVSSLSYVLDVAENVGKVFSVVGTTIGAAAARLGMFVAGDFAGAKSVTNDWLTSIDATLNRQTFGQKLRKQMDLVKAGVSETAAAVEAAKPKLSFENFNEKKGKKDNSASQALKQQLRDEKAEREQILKRDLLEQKDAREEQKEGYSLQQTFLEAYYSARIIDEATYTAAVASSRASYIDNLNRTFAAEEALVRAARSAADARGDKVDSQKLTTELVEIENQHAKAIRLVNIELAKNELKKRTDRENELRAAVEANLGPLDAYALALKKISDLQAKGLDEGTAQKMGKRAWAEYVDAAKKAAYETDEVFNVAKATGDGLQEFLGEATKSAIEGDFKSIGASFQKMVEKMLQQALMANLTKALMGDGAGVGSSFGNGFLSTAISAGMSLFGGSSAGATSSGMPDFMRGGKADGGSIRAGTLQEVNERGTELLMMGGKSYLMAGEDGYIKSAERMRAESSSASSSGSRGQQAQQLVQINVINQGKPAEVESQKQRQGSSGAIIDLVLREVAKDIAQGGGPVSGALEKTYGSSRAAGASQ